MCVYIIFNIEFYWSIILLCIIIKYVLLGNGYFIVYKTYRCIIFFVLYKQSMEKSIKYCYLVQNLILILLYATERNGS